MNFKKASGVLALSLASSVAAAANYQAEVGLNHTDLDYADMQSLYGVYHFSEVSTANHPLAEAAFLEKSNNVQAMYLTTDGGDSQTIGAEFFLGSMFYIAPGYVNTSPDVGSSDGTFFAALGLTPMDGMRITTTVPEEDYELNLDMKYVRSLSGDTAVNFELGYADGGDFDDTLSIEGDYYLNKSLSFGAILISADDTAYGIRANNFFTEKFRAGLSFISADAADTLALDASFRF